MVDVAIKRADDSCACEPLAVEWLAWQIRHSTLRTAIARSAKDLDAVVDAISELAALLLTYNDDSTYTDTLGFDAAQEVEAAYATKSAERQAHLLRGGDDRITHPKTVRAMMDVGSLTDEDMLAYLRSRGYELVSDAYPEYKNFAW